MYADASYLVLDQPPDLLVGRWRRDDVAVRPDDVAVKRETHRISHAAHQNSSLANHTRARRDGTRTRYQAPNRNVVTIPNARPILMKAKPVSRSAGQRQGKTKSARQPFVSAERVHPCVRARSKAMVAAVAPKPMLTQSNRGQCALPLRCAPQKTPNPKPRATPTA